MQVPETTDAPGSIPADDGTASGAGAAETETAGACRPWRWALVAGKVALIALVLLLVGRHVYANWSRLAARDWDLRPGAMILAFGAFLIALFYRGGIWYLQVRNTHLCPPKWPTIAGDLVAKLGTYLPGKVWAVLGRAYFLSRNTSISMLSASAFSTVSQVCIIVAGAACGLLAAPLLVPAGYGWIMAASGLICLSGLVFVAAPRFFAGFADRALGLIGRGPMKVDMSSSQLAWWITLSISSVLLSGLTFALFVATFQPIGLGDIASLVGCFALAGVAGLLAFFAPGGLGVREGVIMVVLTPMMGPETAIVVSLAYRLWLTLGQLTCAGIGLVILKRMAIPLPNERNH